MIKLMSKNYRINIMKFLKSFKLFNILTLFILGLPQLVYSDDIFFMPGYIESGNSEMAGSGISRLIGVILGLLGYIAVIIVSLAVVFFLWGLIKYVIARSDEDRKNARAIIVNGLIILFVMVSVWSLVAIVNRSLGIDRVSPGGTSWSETIEVFKN